VSAFLLSCNSNTEKTAATTASTATEPSKPAMDMPYTASYTSNWSNEVSDADQKMVLMSYKDWSDNNMAGLLAAMGDTVTVEMSSGLHKVLPRADLGKMWSTYRDSLSSVKIDMESWHKMYAADKKESYIVTWYSETDTYKDGRVDSASYHDINQVKDGKIIWYSQYKRPKK
jgi:ketosteroid isomerase-like protein